MAPRFRGVTDVRQIPDSMPGPCAPPRKWNATSGWGGFGPLPVDLSPNEHPSSPGAQNGGQQHAGALPSTSVRQTRGSGTGVRICNGAGGDQCPDKTRGRVAPQVWAEILRAGRPTNHEEGGGGAETATHRPPPPSPPRVEGGRQRDAVRLRESLSASLDDTVGAASRAGVKTDPSAPRPKPLRRRGPIDRGDSTPQTHKAIHPTPTPPPPLPSPPVQALWP